MNQIQKLISKEMNCTKTTTVEKIQNTGQVAVEPTAVADQ